jgi:Transglutaminase-like superfamily
VEILRPRTSASLSGGEPFAEVAVAWRDFSDEAATIRKLINQGSGDLALKEFTLGVIHDAGAASRAELDQALAIGEWVQRNIFYVHEHGEILQRPATTLRLRAGDCDDFAILICSMLGTVGIREKACIIKTGKGTGAAAVGPMRYSHIFAVALPVQDGKPHRLTLDATLEADKYPIRDLVNPIALVKARGDRVEPLFV